MTARLAFALVLVLCSGLAQAQAQSARALRWIVPFPPGGPADVIARLVAPRLSAELGQPVVIDNRAGGASNIGHEAAARAAPDGTTILYVVPNVVTNWLLTKGSVDPVKELQPVARLTTPAYVMLAHPGFAPRTPAEIIAAAKSRPVSCASGGGLPAFGCDWLRSATGAEFVHIPYKGNAPALNDLVGGQVNLLIDLFNTALPQIRAGRVRAVALTGERRGPPLPELPVIAETLPGFVLVGWHGVMAPPGVAAPVIERIGAAFAAALGDAEVARRIGESHIEVAPTGAASFGRVITEDLAKYARIIADAGIKRE